MKVSRTPSPGFTLIELMIVLAVVSILAAVAYPAYQAQMRDARRADGQGFLLEMMSLQERFYTENNIYTDDLTDLNYDSANGVESTDGFYSVTAAACGADPLTACVNLIATALGPQVADGNLELNSRNQTVGEW